MPQIEFSPITIKIIEHAGKNGPVTADRFVVAIHDACIQKVKGVCIDDLDDVMYAIHDYSINFGITANRLREYRQQHEQISLENITYFANMLEAASKAAKENNEAYLTPGRVMRCIMNAPDDVIKNCFCSRIQMQSKQTNRQIHEVMPEQPASKSNSLKDDLHIKPESVSVDSIMQLLDSLESAMLQKSSDEVHTDLQ